MSKLGDVRGQFPEAYRISKYNGTGTDGIPGMERAGAGAGVRLEVV